MTNKDSNHHLNRSMDLGRKVTNLLSKRNELAQERFNTRVGKALNTHLAPLMRKPMQPWELWNNWYRYGVDLGQRWVLFWDTLRQRGNNFLEHERSGMPPLLHFEYEMVMDGRELGRPVNYALVRILPADDLEIDPKRRPYIIIDPRAGHGPGVGGFKDDSQVGVALRDGHPVYFVIFFPEPEPDQTLLDVCDAERQFVARVRALHPDSAKPVVVGNCQGGWAAMMLAAANPEDTGPIVINGAPMSYWGGAWSEGEGDNPMRYAGGNLGGTWLASFTADIGNGLFDGAYLVQNFENLNPANTFWDKYYNLYSKVDSEGPRFLEFERWWGGFYLLNKEEIEWIVQNLFVGNKLWTGGVRSGAGKFFDLREIQSPIILFASMGDNITPPQQAFNWVADVYGSTEEIKARGQVIVGLLHEDIGHLGIFVSGNVARKEHTQIVSVLKSIERLPPGLYGMEIIETERDGTTDYDVQFIERSLEDVTAALNRFERNDERPFEAVNELSEFNQRAYELFAQPLVQRLSNDFIAKLLREFHPSRAERWAISDLNPWLGWLSAAADQARANRRVTDPDGPMPRVERFMSELISASLEYYRDVRDAGSEAAFFQTYGNIYSLYMAEKPEQPGRELPSDPRELPYVKEALASVDAGGYPEALARVAVLLAYRGEPIPLARVALKKELVEQYRDLLPQMTNHEWRRIRGEQEIIVAYEPQLALETLPDLLQLPSDRERLITLIESMINDPRVEQLKKTPQQTAMYERISELLGFPSTANRNQHPEKKEK